MINNILVIGRLTRDPEKRRTNNGKSVATFTIASDRDFKNAQGEKETDFIPVVVWRGLADTCCEYLSKGKLVAVEGRLQIRMYEAKDGSKRTAAEIVAQNVQFLSPRKTNSFSSDNSKDDENEFKEMAPLDDIPF